MSENAEFDANATPICVTGASGFIAAHLTAQLLECGYTVRGTVRNADDAQRYAYLTSLPHANGRLELVAADLLDWPSLDRAVSGCRCVFHTASQYLLDTKHPQTDLVDPAVQGTLGILEACLKSPSVQRVVITSSMAAITDQPGNDVLTEADWNKRSSLTRNPYYYSKTLAERAAWDFVEQHSPNFEVVVINPFMVIGPSHGPGLNTSNAVIAEIIQGKMPGILSLAWGFVDVRDVALAHIRAMQNPRAAGRYLCAHETWTMAELVSRLKSLELDQHHLPSMNLDHAAGRLLVRLLSYFQPPGRRSYLQTNLGRIPKFDNSKIKTELGIEFRPLEDTLRDTVEDLQRWGHI